MHYQNDSDSQTRIANHLSIHNVKQQMLVIAGVDGRSANTIAAIIACQPSKHPAYTPFTVANSSIGRKLCHKSEKEDSFRKAAQRHLFELFRECQPRIGIEFISRVKGSYNPKNVKYFAATYVDNLTPLADAIFQTVIKSPDFAKAKRIPKPRDRKDAIGALFDRAIREGLKSLPDAISDDPSQFVIRPRKKMSELDNVCERLQKFAENAELDQLVKVGHLLLAKIREKAGNHITARESGSIQWDIAQALEELAKVGQTVPPKPDNSFSDNTDSRAEEILSVGEFYFGRGFVLVENYGLSESNTCLCSDGSSCKSAGKHPRGGLELAKMRNMHELSSRIESHPEMNIGIAVGKESGFNVLDYDGEAGLGLREFHKDYDLLPETLENSTSGGKGRHALIKYFPGLKNTVKAIDGLDILTDGFQILVYPSVNVKGAYTWIDPESEIVEASDDLKTFLLEIAGKENNKANIQVIADNSAPHGLGNQSPYRHGYNDGTRNKGLFGVACALRGKRGGTFDEILAELRRRNDLCSPPIEDSELIKITASACQYERMKEAA